LDTDSVDFVSWFVKAHDVLIELFRGTAAI